MKLKKVFVTYENGAGGKARPYLIWRCNRNLAKARRVVKLLQERGYHDIELHAIFVPEECQTFDISEGTLYNK